MDALETKVDPDGIGPVPKLPYWAKTTPDLLSDLVTTSSGLSSSEAADRLRQYGPNILHEARNAGAIHAFARQLASPLVLVLIFAAVVAGSVGEVHDSVIIGCIILISCVLGFSQEYAATKAVDALRKRISLSAAVRRDGVELEVAVSHLVPGDIIQLSAGSLIPADGIILTSRDLNVNEAVLTGESFPTNKAPGLSPSEAPIASRTNCVFMGTSVRSGTATAVVVATGRQTQFATIASAMMREAPESGFSIGIRNFGNLITKLMLIIVLLVFVANLLLERPLIDSLLFSLALAVGLTPELLPAIISITLARGARVMARNGAIVRRLEAIENLGSMNLLCTDKTGTLTEGVIYLDTCLDPIGDPSERVRELAVLNAALQSGMKNPLDDAILRAAHAMTVDRKVDELPYDFMRKRLSVVVRRETTNQLICKGAVSAVLGICTSVRDSNGMRVIDGASRKQLESNYRKWSEEGLRVIAVSTRQFPQSKTSFEASDESDLCLEGFLLFLDPPKAGVKQALSALRRRGISTKIISGDNRFVVKHLASAVGLSSKNVMTGAQLAAMGTEALIARAPDIDLFVEIDPNQKELIIRSIRRAHIVVGYLGDGINDAPALHEADVGISVDSAVDVARDAADIVLLRRDLHVLTRGIDDGRRTFANTLKYISIATSANLGNMISMAVASLFLPFLPLLAKQILLNNLLADIPAMTIATDNIDKEAANKPRNWDIKAIQRFMLYFGPVSSVFDFLSFGVLLLAMDATVDQFRTGWFVESLITQLLTMLIVRTKSRSWSSRPSSPLLWSSASIAFVAIALPYSPAASVFGFVALPFYMMLSLLAISFAFAATLECVKGMYYRHRG